MVLGKSKLVELKGAISVTNLEKAILEMKEQFSKVALIVSENCPEYEKEFETYCNEALMSRSELDRSLKHLQFGASILEIGGGILALSYQLAREGFNVTTVEPIGPGFGPIEKLMKCFEKQAQKEGLNTELIRTGIEKIGNQKQYDFIFSINVMEHLCDPYLVLRNIPKLLKKNTCYRFICPNYNFPYEPHFAKVLFRRKKGSFYLPERRIDWLKNNGVDVKGLYESLNFITLREVKKTARRNGLHLTVNREATFNLFTRAINDPILRNRHRMFGYIIKIINSLKLEKLISLLPVDLQPVMDVEVFSQK